MLDFYNNCFPTEVRETVLLPRNVTSSSHGSWFNLDSSNPWKRLQGSHKSHKTVWVAHSDCSQQGT